MTAGRSAPLCWSLLSVCALLVSADPKNITAESGHNVTLTCRASNNEPICVVEWSRADLGTEYVLFYRQMRTVPDNQHPSFKNRVDLQDRQMKGGDLSLVLQNVVINDTGRYECRVQECREPPHLESANIRRDPISTVYLRVGPPGQGGRSAGLAARLSVSPLLIVVAVAAAAF